MTSETQRLACQADVGRLATTREQYAAQVANVEANAEVVAQAIVQTAVSRALMVDPFCRTYDTHTRLIIAARSAERHLERSRTKVFGRRWAS